MSNLVSLTCTSLQILDKTQMGVFPISRFLVKSITNKHCRNSRASIDIDMKLGLVTELDKTSTMTSKKLMMTSYRQIVLSSSFFWFMFDLEQSGTWIPGAWSMILTFSSIATFYLAKKKTELKTLKHSSHTIGLSKGTIFAKKMVVFWKKMLTLAKLSGPSY